MYRIHIKHFASFTAVCMIFISFEIWPLPNVISVGWTISLYTKISKNSRPPWGVLLASLEFWANRRSVRFSCDERSKAFWALQPIKLMVSFVSPAMVCVLCAVCGSSMDWAWVMCLWCARETRPIVWRLATSRPDDPTWNECAVKRCCDGPFRWPSLFDRAFVRQPFRPVAMQGFRDAMFQQCETMAPKMCAEVCRCRPDEMACLPVHPMS